MGRVRLTRLELKIVSLPDIPEKATLERELKRAQDDLDRGDVTYPSILCSRLSICFLRIRYFFKPHPSDSNIQLLLKGLILYSVITLLFFGPCAVIVFAMEKMPNWGIVRLGVI